MKPKDTEPIIDWGKYPRRDPDLVDWSQCALYRLYRYRLAFPANKHAPRHPGNVHPQPKKRP